MVKNPPSNAQDPRSIPCWGTKIPGLDDWAPHPLVHHSKDPSHEKKKKKKRNLPKSQYTVSGRSWGFDSEMTPKTEESHFCITPIWPGVGTWQVLNASNYWGATLFWILNSTSHKTINAWNLTTLLHMGVAWALWRRGGWGPHTVLPEITASLYYFMTWGKVFNQTVAQLSLHQWDDNNTTSSGPGKVKWVDMYIMNL